MAGRVRLHAKAAFTAYLSRLKNKPIEVVVRVARRKPSRQKRGFWWAVVIPTIASELGYLDCEHDAVHDAVVRAVAGLKPGSDPRLEIRVSTSDEAMDDEDYGVLIEQATIWAATDLGIIIPDPERS